MSLVVSKPCREDEESRHARVNDWKIPLAFNKLRHTVSIEGSNSMPQGWRMKERVSDVNLMIKNAMGKCNFNR